jgi:peptidoglycan/xylan/chitin deacetylase (PgdA/CDA1 family)
VKQFQKLRATRIAVICDPNHGSEPKGLRQSQRKLARIDWRRDTWSFATRVVGMGKYLLRVVVLIALCSVPFQTAGFTANTDRRPPEGMSATILLYHRFGAVPDTTTVRTSAFASQLEFLHDHGYAVVPLRDVVAFLTGHGQLPPRAVAITADDGYRSVFTEMKPLVEKYKIPVTLFIYPSVISVAPQAMTWGQLEDLQRTGLFEIESHTYSHPNFNVEKRRLSPTDYRKLVETQLSKSKEVLEQRLGRGVDLLAWAYGIYDDQLMRAAKQAGYVAAFSVDQRKATREGNLMAIPRFTVSERDVGKVFAELLRHP